MHQPYASQLGAISLALAISADLLLDFLTEDCNFSAWKIFLKRSVPVRQ